METPNALPVSLKGRIGTDTILAAAAEAKQAIAQAYKLYDARPADLNTTERELIAVRARADLLRKITFGLLKTGTKRIKELERKIIKLRLPLDVPLLRMRMTLDKELDEAWRVVGEGFAAMGGCERFWFISGEQGAVGRILDLQPCDLSIFPPPALDISPYPIIFEFGDNRFVPCPLGMFLRMGSQPYQFFSWHDARIGEQEEPFREKDPPSDAFVIFNTWEYVTPEGQPDPNLPRDANPKISVVRYGRVAFFLGDVFRLDFLASNIETSRRFAEAVHNYQYALGVRKPS